jgi:hypothetical protein
MRRLARATQPLLTLGPHPSDDIARARVDLTPTGRAVLPPRADHVQLNGVDRWIDGTHLIGSQVAWRYDERLETSVPA